MSFVVWKQCSSPFTLPEIVKEDQTVVNHHMVVEKMESLGKLELVKYYIKDIVEHEVIKDWWVDPKVILIVSGEVAGCINLAKIDSSSIDMDSATIRVKLPQPEICYFKINHQESKVYKMENEYFSQPELVDKAYQIAEKQLESAAIKMKILDQTKVNAELVLKPLLEQLTNKKVVFTYK
jgi:predicted RNase H-like nuclease